MSEFVSQQEFDALLSGKPLPEKKIDNSNGKKTVAELHHWYLKKRNENEEGYIAKGNVTGHPRMMDTSFVTTSEVLSVRVDMDIEAVIIETKNTEYHCRLSECDYSKEDTYDMIPNLTEYAKQYGIQKEYDLEDDSILLVLSDHEQYYFKTALLKKSGLIFEGKMHVHIGSFQDSCLVSFHEVDEIFKLEKSIDIRYFPHAAHLETYFWETSDMPVYLENDGERMIYYTTVDGVIALNPGDRKKVCKENTLSEKDTPLLAGGDLYPSIVIGGNDN